MLAAREFASVPDLDNDLLGFDDFFSIANDDVDDGTLSL